MEQAEIWRAVDAAKNALDNEFSPQGYNVGFNASAAAGQTVMHLHVHVIPRFQGDVDDPRGGVRGVIPSKMGYDPDGTPLKSSVADAEDRTARLYSPFAELPGFVGGVEDALAPPLRRALQLAERADIVAAFVQPSGLAVIEGDLRDALARGATVRLLTGDYLNATSPDALRSLLGLQAEYPESLRPYFFLGGGTASFHAKAYIFMREIDGVAYIGSSNLTKTALTDGIEWNLRAISSADKNQFDAAQSRFEELLDLPEVSPLTRELVERYSQRARIPEGPDPRTPPPPPHELQLEALDALRALRADGATAGLVVMATGLGKTYLSALDCSATRAETALFIAHRAEILEQAVDSFRRVFPDKILGVLTGDRKEPDADILFASVQTLALKKNLQQFDSKHFEYIVVDEFHHASASTYRKVIGHFEPQFLIGLTATPDRMDGASILELCHENLAYRAGLVRGIACKLLVPFRYFGVKDEVDFQPIPWKGRWRTEELTAHVATRERAEQTLREYRRHAPDGRRRTLAFCCSVAHADFMAQFFVEQGIRAASVHSGTSSAPRTESLRQLQSGELEILCAVDVFNEGLDVPDINVVLMLRPTESPVIFLQQLGRGLRRPDTSDKRYLTIIDFIGNHHSFLTKPQALVALTGQDLAAGAALEAVKRDTLDLPEGCYVDIETEAIEMLERFGRLSKDDMLIYEYVTLRDGHGRRPTAAEVLATGVHMKPVRDRHGNWFEFVRAQDDLDDVEQRVLERHHAWFTDLMKTSMSRSYKMVTLRAMLEENTLREPVPVDDLVRNAFRILNDDLVLHHELREVRQAEDPVVALEATWRNEPLRRWSDGRSDSRRWFTLDDAHFRFRGDVREEDAEAFDQMTAEIVELRLAEHRNKLRSTITGEVTPIRLRVSHANHRPILRLDRKRHPELPPADRDELVTVDGAEYLFGFRKVAVNKAATLEGSENDLPRLMRKWFGPNAGHPGSHHFVLLTHHDEGWQLRPEIDERSENVSASIALPGLPYFNDLKVACGAFEGQERGQSHRRLIHVDADLELDPEKHFVVQAEGDSMDGGITPIKDGDLVLCEWLSATDVEEVEGAPCLVTGGEPPATTLAALKVPIRQGRKWILRSFNPSFVDEEIAAGMTLLPVARFVQVVTELDGPVLWGRYDRDQAAAIFGLKSDRSWQVGQRDVVVRGQGHSILFVKLHKGKDTPPEQRYADRFLSPVEFQWESQDKTKPTHKKGRNIIEQTENGQRIHLFCRYDDSENFVYCGELIYLRHQGGEPIRIWFELARPLPDGLWRLWAT